MQSIIVSEDVTVIMLVAVVLMSEMRTSCGRKSKRATLQIRSRSDSNPETLPIPVCKRFVDENMLFIDSVSFDRSKCFQQLIVQMERTLIIQGS